MNDKRIFNRLLNCAQRSKDPSTQNSAALVNPYGEVLLYAYNRLPPGVKDLPERWQSPQKYLWVEHAERMLLQGALHSHTPTESTTLFALWAACADCARAIVSAGIREVVTVSKLMSITRPTWSESVSVGQQILAEAGVIQRQYTGLIGGQIRFGGQLVEI